MGVRRKGGDGIGATKREEDFFPYRLAVLNIYSYIRAGEETSSALSGSGGRGCA